MSPPRGWAAEEVVAEEAWDREVGRLRGQASFAPRGQRRLVTGRNLWKPRFAPPQMGFRAIPGRLGQQRGWEPGFLCGEGHGLRQELQGLTSPSLPAPPPAESPALTQQPGAREPVLVLIRTPALPPPSSPRLILQPLHGCGKSIISWVTRKTD